MRIAVVGAGGMGARACAELARTAGVDEVVLADLDAERAQRVAAALAGAAARIASRPLDVLDAGAARALFSSVDLVLNCAGPYFRLGLPTLDAAIAARRPYVDLCDDPEPTLAMLARDEEARRAGVAAVIGMGASPGLSNLLAARAARRLDRVIDCFTVWPLDGAEQSAMNAASDAAASDGAASAAAVHLMEQISGRIRVVEGGERVQRAPLAAIALDYPGFGRGTAWTVGHPEPLTLARSLGVAGRAANAMLVRPATLAYLRSLQRDLDRGALTHERAAAALVSIPTRRSLVAAARALWIPGPGALPPFFVLLRGERGGRRVRVGCHVTALPPGMAGATAVPAALAATQLLARPPAPGVHPPEAVLGDDLLEALRPLCPGPPASLDALAPVVEEEDAR